MTTDKPFDARLAIDCVCDLFIARSSVAHEPVDVAEYAALGAAVAAAREAEKATDEDRVELVAAAREAVSVAANALLAALVRDIKTITEES